jgi:hypothetical protein
LFSYIGTQADKLGEAMTGMDELLTIMPEAESNMKNAKESIEQKIRTERFTKSKMIDEYLRAKKLGIDYDIRKDLYDVVETFDMSTLKDFHDSYISQGTRVIIVLGKKEELDLDVLVNYGEVEHLTLEDIFGY